MQFGLFGGVLVYSMHLENKKKWKNETAWYSMKFLSEISNKTDTTPNLLPLLLILKIQKHQPLLLNAGLLEGHWVEQMTYPSWKGKRNKFATPCRS